jgi:hypothetical protein
MSDGSGLWAPETHFDFQGDTLQDVTTAYSVFLEVCAASRHKAFVDRLAADPDAARSEAAMFSWLWARKLAPSINETATQGGMDFLCSSADIPFLVEVTGLSKAAVVNKSGWPDTLDEIAQTFSMITAQLAGKGQHKSRQLSTGQASIPCVLAICLAHPGASALLSTMAAEWLMVSDPKIKVPIVAQGTALGQTRLVTDLKRSVFFGPRDGVIVPMRESISAILLVALWDRQLDVVGMLHPKPTVPLNYRVFARVPFLRVGWPLMNPIEMEWVIGDPGPLIAHHIKVALADNELKGK